MTIHEVEAHRTDPVHEITSRFWPGSYGDRPEPWQRTYECVCGGDLGMDEEGAGDIDVEGAFESHLESLTESSEKEE